jgi:hypothetical protein
MNNPRQNMDYSVNELAKEFAKAPTDYDRWQAFIVLTIRNGYRPKMTKVAITWMLQKESQKYLQRLWDCNVGAKTAGRLIGSLIFVTRNCRD